MARFLFLHGSWHGAWCWHKVLPCLRALGHSVRAIDLPGRGQSPANPLFVDLKQMVDVAEAALSFSERTVVVAHSRNGIAASSLAERAADRISRTIYLAAFMLPARARVIDFLPDPPSLLSGHIAINRIGLWDRLDPMVYREALYADCSEADIELCRTLRFRELVRPALTRLRLGTQYESVPRAYIRLTEDRAVSLALQDRFLGAVSADRVESIAASHSAYFSCPDILADRIVKLSGN